MHLINQLLHSAAKNWRVETEYAGRMEHFCFFCGKYQGGCKENHEPDCLHVKAKKYLRTKKG